MLNCCVKMGCVFWLVICVVTSGHPVEADDPGYPEAGPIQKTTPIGNLMRVPPAMQREGIINTLILTAESDSRTERWIIRASSSTIQYGVWHDRWWQRENALAEDHLNKEGFVANRSMPGTGKSLAEAFKMTKGVSRAPDSKQVKQPVKETSTRFSLLYLDAKNLEICASLSNAQLKAFRDGPLQPVISDIRRNAVLTRNDLLFHVFEMDEPVGARSTGSSANLPIEPGMPGDWDKHRGR